MFYSKKTFSQVSARGVFDMKLRSSVLKVWGVQARLGSISKHSRGEEGLVYSRKPRFLVFHFRSGCFICVNMSLFPHFNWGPNIIFLGFPRGSGKRSPSDFFNVKTSV